MKKLFSMVLIFVMAFTLSACTNDDYSKLEGQLETLQADYDDLVSEKQTLEEAISELEDQEEDYQTEITRLEEQIARVQEQIYDNVITVTFTDEYGVFASQTVGYDDTYNGTLLELLELNFEVDVSTSEYGSFLNSIEHLTPQAGTYISISKNDVPSMVGIDSLSYADGDMISLEVIWWDTTLQAVDEAINLFIIQHASDYVNTASINYNVLLALNLLNIENDYITSTEINSYVDGLTLTTVNDYFKAIMMKSVAGADVTSLLTDLASIVSPGPYGKTAYGLLAMNAVEHTVDFADFETNALADLTTNTPYNLGLDAGAISLVALSQYENQDIIIDEFITWIQTSQLDTGGVQTRDVEWDDTVYPGVENAASISQVIMALIAQDMNPNGAFFTTNDNTLITRLLEFQTETGTFDYDLTDDIDEDLMFSTPQAFLALVVFQQYVNTLEAVNPYYFK